MDGKALGVTIRELGRHAAAVIDEVERSGRHIVISRYGRAVAFVGPIPVDYVPTDYERMHVAPHFDGMAPLEAAEMNEAVELDDVERSMLDEVSTVAPRWWMPTVRLDAAMRRALFRLEIDHDVIESRPGGGWRPTKAGLRAVRDAAR